MGADILIIEDNEANLELMSYLLQAFGHSVRSAGDGEEGLNLATALRPALIICDIQLPVMDGLEVVQRLRRSPELSDVRCVAVTALAMVGDRERILGAGFDGYIAKPLVPEQFVQEVESFLPPQQSAPAAAAPTSARDNSEKGRATILVVDNDPVNLELARSTLEPHSYAVLVASGVQEALAQLQDNMPNLIVSDVRMTDGSGYELLAALRQMDLLSRIPVLLVSSTYHDEGSRLRGIEAGACDYLFRPLEPTVFLQEVERRLKESMV